MPSATLTYPAKYLRNGQFRRTSETEQWPSTSELSFNQSSRSEIPRMSKDQPRGRQLRRV